MLAAAVGEVEPMLLRNLFAFVSGLFATSIVATFLHIAHTRFVAPPPTGMDWSSPAAVAAFAAGFSPLAHALLVLSWSLAALAGSFACAKLAGSQRTWLGLSIGVLVGAMNAANAAQFPHPAWVEAGNIALPPLAAWLGARLAQRPTADQNGLASTR
jgi:hypothetical protein